MNIDINYKEEVHIPEWLEQELNGDRLLARILIQRGLDTPAKVREFLDPEFYQATSAVDFPAMEKAVSKLLKAVNDGKKVCVYGDYDVDGVTSTVILLELIKKLGGIAIYHLPDRFKEGYGMSKGVVRRLADEVEMIITCDCGISNYEEVALAKKLGLGVIVTDHHQLPAELPPADVILSPKLLPEDHRAYELPGAGMAYFLAEGVLSKVGKAEECGEFMDLLSLAIVADVVPLKGENRYRLQRGLPCLANSKRSGLIELFKNSGITSSAELTEEDIAYRLAPQINSAGRILQADLAVELLLSEDQFQAQKYAAEITAVNERRKKLQDEVLEEALALLENREEGEPVVLYQPHWNQGVIGIAAGRLAEELQVPALLMCQKEDGETVTGSARSVPGIHINNKLKQCEKNLIKFGGHAGAAGFSLERDKLTAFRKNISRILGEAIVRLERRPVLDIDGELSLVDLKMEDYFRLRKLAPFGEGNPQPRFIAPDAEVVYSRSTTGARHLRLIVAQDGIRHPAIWWWAGEKEPGDRVDLIYSLSLNNFQGKQELQLVVQGIHQEEEKEKIEKEHAEKTSRDRKLKFQLLDYRNWKDKKKELPEFKDAGYYYEGLTEADRIETINRYQMSNKKTLVLLSCPPSIEIFKELIYASHPSKLVLAFCSSDLIDYRFFTTQLSGLVKYVLNSKNGEVDVYQLAALTGQLESTVVAGLQYLEVRGFISLDTFNPRYYLVRSGEEEEGRENRGRKFKALKSLLQETASFRKHLLKIKEEEINNIVN